MGAPQRAEKESRPIHDTGVREKADVQFSVEYRCLRRDLESTAKRSSVGHRYHQHAARPGAADAARRDLYAGIAEELAQGRVYVYRVALQVFDCVAGLEDRRVESESAAIEKVVTVGEAKVDLDRVARGGECGDLLRRE